MIFFPLTKQKQIRLTIFQRAGSLQAQSHVWEEIGQSVFVRQLHNPLPLFKHGLTEICSHKIMIQS